MAHNRSDSVRRRARAAIAAAGLCLAAILVWAWADPGDLSQARPGLRGWLMLRLSRAQAPGRDAVVPGGSARGRMIYILGGSQDSLFVKYTVAARLYREGDTVVVLHVPGITSYDPVLDRNLTNDEWSFKQLTGRGIAARDIRFVAVPESRFGTLNEARGVARVLSGGGPRKLLLVCSSYHAARVWTSFSAVLDFARIEIELETAGERAGLDTLLGEYAKLEFYKYILIPSIRLSQGPGSDASVYRAPVSQSR